SVLRYFDAAEGLNRLLAPVFTHIWGLPAETVPAILIGILKKEIAVAMLAPLGLTTKQLIIACTILALYFPCVATFFVLLKELGVKDLLKTLSLMIFISLLVGGSMNWLFPNF
ncbi:MAG TPA: nucleoside recognition domain-containing protein, partial [bacterium]|nr:nucleoside recognition domain-containing protein [bacterium]